MCFQPAPLTADLARSQVEEPAEPDDPPSEEPPSEEPPAAQAEVAQAGTGVAETVASAAGGLAVDRLAGAGNAGIAELLLDNLRLLLQPVLHVLPIPVVICAQALDIICRRV